MRTSLDASERLRRLERILAGTPPGARDDAIRRSLDRIHELTVLLQESDHAEDDVDAIAMRLLLNEHAAVVGQLRLSAQQAGQHLDAVPRVLADVRKFLWRDEKLREAFEYRADGDESGSHGEPAPADEPQ